MTDLRKPVRRVSRGLIREAGKVREVVVILRPPNVLMIFTLELTSPA
jgi:hypothetical protein